MHDSASTRQHRREPPSHRRFSWCCSFAVPSQSPDHYLQHHHHRQSQQQHCSVSTPESRPRSLSKHFHNAPSQKTELPPKSTQNSFPNSPQSQASNTSSSSKLGLRRILSPGRVSPIDDAVSAPASTSLPSAEVPKLPLSNDIDAPDNSAVQEEDSTGNFDVRLNLKGRNGTGSLVLELNSEVLAANSSVFADLIAEYRRSSKGMCRIEVPEIENVNIFRETVELMFDGDITTRLLKIGVYRVIDILEQYIPRIGFSGITFIKIQSSVVNTLKNVNALWGRKGGVNVKMDRQSLNQHLCPKTLVCCIKI